MSCKIAHSSAPKTFGKGSHPASSPKTTAKASSPPQKDVRQSTIVLRSFRAKEAVNGNHELYSFAIYYAYPLRDAISLHHSLPVSEFLAPTMVKNDDNEPPPLVDASFSDSDDNESIHNDELPFLPIAKMQITDDI
jgi:hypothetical protein